MSQHAAVVLPSPQGRASAKLVLHEPGTPTLPAQAVNFDALPDSAIFRPKATQAVLGISHSTYWRMVRRGVLKTVKISPRVTGNRVGDIRAFLASLSGEAA